MKATVKYLFYLSIAIMLAGCLEGASNQDLTSGEELQRPLPGDYVYNFTIPFVNVW